MFMARNIATPITRVNRKSYGALYKNSDMTLGERLKAARKHAKLTQEALAKRVGMSQPTLSDLENGNSLGTSFVVALARATGVQAAWLAEERGPMFDPDDAQPTADLDPLHLPEWIELARFSTQIPSNASLRATMEFLFHIDQAHRGRILSDTTHKLAVAALQAQVAGLSEQELAPILQILQNTIEAKRPKSTVNPAIVSEAPTPESELDRKAREAIALAVPGNSESKHATAARGEGQRKRR
ncbi:helix-turn-helix domain-containing protein [Paraburkholderia sp.]|uniref:helix-turn-helix domain-containing protein n=1 Tax=Paraburkholderia sp. TaxID=1926495 RepID=UPI0039784B9E